MQKMQLSVRYKVKCCYYSLSETNTSSKQKIRSGAVRPEIVAEQRMQHIKPLQHFSNKSHTDAKSEDHMIFIKTR